MKIDRTAQINYESKFNEKVDHFKNHQKYNWLREYADGALRFHGEFGFMGIKARDFMDRVNKLPLDYIQDWLEGKNQLEWI